MAFGWVADDIGVHNIRFKNADDGIAPGSLKKY
jgi:hypothetical protein